MAVITRKTVRSVALPAEHGGWSFWLEPVLLAILVASSSTGFALIIASLASFLIRQPLKIALIDLRKKKLYLRTRMGIGFVALYGFLALLALSASLAGSGVDVLLPLIPAYGIALVQVWIFDVRGDSRHWLPEVIGAVVMSAFAVSIALAGGWTLTASIALAVIVVARGIPTIIYVRARLRQIKSGQANPQVSIALHILSLIIISALAIFGLVPKLSIAAMLILLGRAIFYLKQGAIVQAKIVGFQEITFGFILVIVTALGYTFQI
jgi:hypothetical protein